MWQNHRKHYEVIGKNEQSALRTRTSHKIDHSEEATQYDINNDFENEYLILLRKKKLPTIALPETFHYFRVHARINDQTINPQTCLYYRFSQYQILDRKFLHFGVFDQF